MDDSACVQGLRNDNELLFPGLSHTAGEENEKWQCLVSQDGTWLGRGASGLVALLKPLMGSADNSAPRPRKVTRSGFTFLLSFALCFSTTRNLAQTYLQ